MAHLKGRALCINMVGYLAQLTIAVAGGSNSLGRRNRIGHGMAGGVALTQSICRGRISISSVSKLLRQRCDGRGFTPMPIEIIARLKVSLTLEPKQVSGRTPPGTSRFLAVLNEMTCRCGFAEGDRPSDLPHGIPRE
jgi:hypothetical protein